MATTTGLTPTEKKAIEALLYVVRRAPNKYNALKVIYYADRLHLERYGRLIYGESYRAMDYGAVPSLAFDVTKEARGDDNPNSCLSSEAKDLARQTLAFANKYDMTVKRDPDMDFLSETDVECLDKAIADYGNMEFPVLMKVAHEDGAYADKCRDDWIPLEDIVRELDNADEIMEYLEMA